MQLEELTTTFGKKYFLEAKRTVPLTTRPRPCAAGTAPARPPECAPHRCGRCPARPGPATEPGGRPCRVDMAMLLGAGTRTLRLPGPIGLAAGFDKDGAAVAGLFEICFAFVEVGSVTQRPQPGNARLRSLCLSEDWGVIIRVQLRGS